MCDLLVPLYRLPEHRIPPGFSFRKPMACEINELKDWIAVAFSPSWAAEASAGLLRTPPTVFLAASIGGEPAGFCCWDCTALGFLGPVGVSGKWRGSGVGAALVGFVLRSMREQGYGYAVVGGAGPIEFFRKCSGAVEIPGSTPGIYERKLKWS
jgi:predicted N-acetyltransferase YhbS